MDHFIAYGHRKIGFLGARKWYGWMTEKKYILDHRASAFKEYMTFLNLYNDNFVRIGEFDSASGYEMMKQILDGGDRPTAIFASSDTMAIGAMKAINEAGLTIPDDISIVGFDDIPTTDFLTPALSTTKVYTEFIGTKSVDLMLEHLESDREIPLKVMVPTELIIKGS